MIVQAMPFPASSLPAGGNPHFVNNVTFLCGFDGADGATTAADESVKTHTFTAMRGNAQLDTGVKKFGLSSLMLDGNGDCAEFADTGDWDMGGTSEALQYEAQICFHSAANLSASHTIMSQYNASGSQRSYLFYYDGTDGKLKFRYTSSGVTLITMVEAPFTPIADSATFQSVCMSRRGSTARLFLDGQIIGTNTDSGNPHNGSAPLRIGGHEASGLITNSFHGWIDEVRISKEIVADGGAGFNAVDYAPQTAAFPRS